MEHFVLTIEARGQAVSQTFAMLEDAPHLAASPDAALWEQSCLHRELLGEALMSRASAACQHGSIRPWELAPQLSFCWRSAERHVSLTLQDRLPKLRPPEDSQMALDFSPRLFFSFSFCEQVVVLSPWGKHILQSSAVC